MNPDTLGIQMRGRTRFAFSVKVILKENKTEVNPQCFSESRWNNVDSVWDINGG